MSNGHKRTASGRKNRLLAGTALTSPAARLALACIVAGSVAGAGGPLAATAVAQEILGGGGAGGGGDGFVDSVGGAGGLAGGGGGGGSGGAVIGGGGNGGAGALPGADAEVGGDGGDDGAYSGGAGGQPGGMDDLSAGGGGGGGGATDFGDHGVEGGAGGDGGLGSVHEGGEVSLSSAATGTDGTPGGSRAGGGGGGGAIVLTGSGSVTTNGQTVTGGAGGTDSIGAGGGGAGIVTVDGGDVSVTGGTVTGGGGGNAYFGGHGGAGVFLYGGGTLDNAGPGTIIGGGGGPGADGGQGGAGVLANQGVVDNAGMIAGGAGGSGINGGIGGSGLRVFGGTIVNQAGATITGGAGGNSRGHEAYSAGNGGVGVVFLDGANGGTLENFDTIIGGSGGTAAGTPGTGGAGVVVNDDNVTIVNGGTITGGLSGHADPSTQVRANAVELNGANNMLELHDGYGFTGNVVANGSIDTLVLGGDADPVDAFDVGNIGGSGQYQGFEAFEKTGTSTWTLTGNNGYHGGTTISEGKLVAASTGALGTGPVVVDGDNTTRLTFDGAGVSATNLEITVNGGRLAFENDTSAGNAQITNNVEFDNVFFSGSSDAGTATIENHGGIHFGGSSSASASTIFTTKYLLFKASSTAGQAHITNARFTDFQDDSAADDASVVNGADAWIDISGHNGGIAIGSVSGDGDIQLGGNILTLGGLGENDTIGGTIQDGGRAGGTGGSLAKIGLGTLMLNGINTYTGLTTVATGTLIVGGDGHSDAKIAGNVDVNAGGTLGGIGTIGGDIDIDGTLSAGNSPGTLTIAGDLTLNGGSTSVFELNTPGVVGGTGAAGNDLVEVGDDLALGGTLDARVAAAGYYRLIDYEGGLTGDSFDTETVTSTAADFTVDNATVETAIAGQVNLSVLGAGQTMQFWDGVDTLGNDTVDGGSGTWQNFATNWTNEAGKANGGWNGSVGVFTGAAGAVTVAGTQSFDTLQFSTDGYALSGGTLALTPANGTAGTLNIDNGVSATIGSTIADGTGTALKKVGGGTLVLSGQNTYTGGTQLLGGTVQISEDANLGHEDGGLIFDGGTLQSMANFATTRNVTLNEGGGIFQTGARLELTGTISGDGKLSKTGGGVLELSNANEYGGGTDVSQGQLAAAVTGALGTGPVNVTTGGGLAFTGDAGAGSLAIALNAAFVSFDDNASAESAGIVNTQGGIYFNDRASAGNATITNAGGGTSFNGSSSAGNANITARDGGTIDFYGNATAGNATITNMAGGFTLFHGANMADAATVINQVGGVVDISDLTSDGIGIGSLSGNGIVHLGSKALTLGDLDQDDIISGVIMDAGASGGTGGSLVKSGTGTLTLTGANTYTGGTTVEGGTLRIGDGGTAGSILEDAEIASAGTLTFDRSDNLTFAGALSGNGSLYKLGGGTLLYDGDGSGFAGDTTVADGGLIVGSDAAHADAVLGGSFAVEDGGLLGGHGTVGSGSDSFVTVSSGGTISPGNSIGTLTVDGDLVFETGSTYLAEIDPALDSDLIDASGGATIGGGTVHAVKAGGVYTPASRWTIIGADGGVTGTFDDLTQNMPFVDLALAYDANHVYIDATRNAVAFCDVAATFNQCSTGDGLETTGVGNPVYNAVAALPDEDSARRALDGLSGEIHASARSALIEDSRFVRKAATARVRAAFDGVGTVSLPVMAYGAGGTQLAPAATDRFAAWGQAFGTWGSFDSDGNAAGLDHDTGGLLVGMDGFVTETWRLGLIAGYSRSSFDAEDRASSGSSDNYHLGLYAGTQWDKLGLRSGLAYTWHDIETSRAVSFPGFTDTLSADYSAGTFQAFGELGYRIDTAAVSFEPFANLAYVSLRNEGFTERGGSAVLTSRSQTTDATFTTLGLRAATGFHLGGIKATAHGMLGWSHAFGDTTPLATHAFAGSDAFTVAGTLIAEDAAVIEAGLDLNLTDTATFGVAYQGQIASDARQHGFKANLTVRF